ncbi:DNA adenine methylase [Halorubrum ezzemoulense]|uniref:DNA adenine methylase n=1 Tax=Halorubrum ezzemoulense TaxID=337243 RepID=UPI0023314AA4|nr:DNA adenine methylase [Halorubrum ezzemoulense]MDB9251865.1 DNA adenine methylase [Halorubrum ezzemoulense]MDB9256274.1 DNA adenine methylase [Halorubrum ezzemoulense]MDB9276985.1 DNA adenine methylase [Halorubrum ezzemoulense]
MVEPILKWAGGKRQLLSEITALFPTTYEAYHEPFVGGGAVFFDQDPDDGTINDLNTRLTTFYEIVRDQPDALIDENKTHEHTEEYYYNARSEFNALFSQSNITRDERVREASLLLYLNRTCFNGLYRENSDGEFNVSFGRYSNPDWVQEQRIRKASRVLQGTAVFNTDFSYVVDEASSGDLVYFDPPYEPVSKTADFNSYQAEGFDREDQRRLRDVVVELTEMNVSVILSNSPPVTELYEDHGVFSIRYVDATRAINSDASSRGEVSEVLITNVPAEAQRRKTLSDFTE